MTISMEIIWLPCGYAAVFCHDRGWGYRCEQCNCIIDPDALCQQVNTQQPQEDTL
jgi:hypothetical protein